MTKRAKLPKWVSEELAAVAPDLIDSTLFKFKVKIQVSKEDGSLASKLVAVDMFADLSLDYETVEADVEDIPAIYAYWAAVYSEARLNVSLLERKVKMRYGEAYERVTTEFNDQKFKPTVEVVKRIVEKDALLAKADLELQKAHMQAGKLYHMVEAIKMKGELARSLVSLKKNEH